MRYTIREIASQLLPFLPPLIVFSLYYPVLEGGFLNLDDFQYVVQNPDIQSLGIINLKYFFSRSYESLWLPVTMISYALDFQIWQLSPFGFHLTNLLLHAINTWLVFHLLRRLGLPLGIAWTACCMFAWHPVQVESVAWIAERKNLLSFSFYLLTHHAWISWLTHKQRRYGILSCFLYCLAVLAKPAAVPGCLILACQSLLFPHMPTPPLKQQSFVRANKTYLGLMLLAALVSSWVTLHMHAINQSLVSEAGAPWSQRILMLIALPIHYGHLLIHPATLAISYTPVAPAVGSFKFFAGLLLWCGGLARLCWTTVKQRPEALWWWWTILFILPVSGIVTIPSWMSDRYLYFPLIGIAVIGLGWLYHFFAPLRLYEIQVSFLLFWLAVSCRNQIKLWENPTDLYEASALRQPYSVDTRYWQLKWCTGNNNFSEASRILTELEKLAPHHPEAVFVRALLATREGNLQDVESLIDEALQKTPDHPPFLWVKGNCLLTRGDYPGAAEIYSRIPATDTYTSEEALLDQIRILLAQRKTKIALSAGEATLQILPHRPEAYLLVAEAKIKKGHFQSALHTLKEGSHVRFATSHIRDRYNQQVKVLITQILEQLGPPPFSKIRKEGASSIITENPV